ncbi:MAG: hypothetical protein KDC33_08380 [Thermoleophilia bacterium]|nr:hypothetical protein [Thermoleophilia bacterium]
MSPSGRRIGRHVVVLGGLVGIVAGPVASLVGERMRRRARLAGFGDDPVGPFREAPCYSRQAGSAEGERQTTATS